MTEPQNEWQNKNGPYTGKDDPWLAIISSAIVLLFFLLVILACMGKI